MHKSYLSPVAVGVACLLIGIIIGNRAEVARSAEKIEQAAHEEFMSTMLSGIALGIIKVDTNRFE